MCAYYEKILSKLCMFGLATTVSFGFGSFLASAAPPNPNNDNDSGTAGIQGSGGVVNMPQGTVYVFGVIGNSTTKWDSASKGLINTSPENMPSIMFKPDGESAINITTSRDLNVGDIWLRAKNTTGTGDSGWVKVWSDQGTTAGFIDEALDSIKASAAGNYSFYYYVDSSNGFATNGYQSGTSYTPGAGAILP